MSQKENYWRELRQNPKNIRLEELEQILRWFGFETREGKGSHTVYKRGEYRMTVPYKKPFLKPIYIKLALEILDELGLGKVSE
ncbi:MAG: type II toxin-antitoxin system HicA family toxin [Chloroflexi bacterium]|nr:type II toxin-antitoxin system HicA family toxin [Chloroflexota bacterium]